MPGFIFLLDSNGDRDEKMNLVLYSSVCETSHWDHELIRKMFTVDVATVMSPFEPGVFHFSWAIGLQKTWGGAGGFWLSSANDNTLWNVVWPRFAN